MAPEVLLSGLSPSTQVWALGVLAHFLLTKQFPYDGPKDLRLKQNPPVKLILEGVPSIPPFHLSKYLGMLSPLPENRPSLQVLAGEWPN